MTFADRLREAMEVKTCSQVEIVEKTGVSREVLRGYLNGDYEPVYDVTCALAKALNINPSWLMGFDGTVMELEYNDNINHPAHYTQGKYEAIDIILDAVKDLPPREAVCVNNILKYILRYHYKNGLQDIKKCRWYVDKLVEIMEEEV